MRLLLSSLLGLVAATTALGRLAPNEVRVAVTLADGAGSLPAKVTLSDGPEGGQLLVVTLTNDRKQDVHLTAAVVELPWAEPGQTQMAEGGTGMQVGPTLVTDLARAGGRAPQSGTFLLGRNPTGSCSLAAFLSWRTFWSKLSWRQGQLRIAADGEGRRVRAGETVALETVWLARFPDWQDALYRYADAIAAELNIHLRPQPYYVGWSTWDYYGRTWTAANVTANLDALVRLIPQANLLQIDGGWWPARGDFQSVRPNLQPGGMKALADTIKAHGLTAGIHFDGMRGDTAATVAHEHPDYFLHTAGGRFVAEPQQNDGERLNNIYFDFSNPKAVDYNRAVAANIRHGWGYDYLKIDFLVFGLDENIRQRAMQDDPHGRIIAYDDGLTSVERLRRALAAWREGMGPDAYFLACSAPFGVVFGYADGLRTGYDIFPNFAAYRKCMEATAGMFFLNGRVTWNDADYDVVRSRADEDATLVPNPEKSGGNLQVNEAEMWADYVGLFGGTKLNSDNLLTLRPERQALFRQSVRLPACDRYLPLDFWQHGHDRSDAFQVMLGRAGGEIYLAIFNWSDHERTYRFSGLRPADQAQFAGWTDQLTVSPHHAVVRHAPLGGEFDRLRRALTVQE